MRNIPLMRIVVLIKNIPRLSATTIAATLILMNVPGVYAQSFLDKLEETVKSRLNQAADPPVADVPNGPVGPPAEELPPPSASQPRLPSILERPASGGPGVAQLPQSQPQSSPDPSSDSAEGIYLGLEAEEAIGGGIGVRVSNVANQSPAWKAGFKSGDRILAINGYALADLDDMVKQLSKVAAGQPVKFLVSRSGRNSELVAVPMNAQLAARIAGQTPREIQALDGQAGPAWLGVMVNDLTDSFRAQFGISVFRGAAITNVAPASPASKAGLQAGDAIIEVSGRPIDTAQALLSWMTTKRPGDAVQLVVYRGINARTVTVVLERNPESVPPIRPDQSFPRPSVALPPAVTNPTVELPARVDGELELTPPTPAVISAADVQSLQREIVRLKEELQLANQRLQQTQQELQAVLSGSDLPE